MNRRRFLAITASSLLVPRAAWARTVWRGRAFGAEVSIDLAGDKSLLSPALDAARDTLVRLEKQFSIYDPASALSRLNREGRLTAPPAFARLMDEVEAVHRVTEGLFDPTIQPVFVRMLATGRRLSEEERADLYALVGWEKVVRRNGEIHFRQPGMALTLNGIAQGFATDSVTEVLAAHGFDDALINIGEFRAGARAADLSVRDLQDVELGRVSLTSSALATSSAHGFAFADGTGHIISPHPSAPAERRGEPDMEWDTVAVEAETATLADALSTALILSRGTGLAERLVQERKIRRVILKSTDGTILQFGA